MFGTIFFFFLYQNKTYTHIDYAHLEHCCKSHAFCSMYMAQDMLINIKYKYKYKKYRRLKYAWVKVFS